MKKFKFAIICLMLLSLVITGVSFMFLGDIIPIHIGIDSTPDQYGSKYFILVFPFVMCVNGVTMLLVVKYAKVTENYKKYTLLTGVILEAMFLLLLLVFSVYIIQYTEDTPAFDISKIMMILFGLLFIVMGNYMPKIEKNRTLGIKTVWSMYNEVTWQKTHRFSGFVGIIVGVLCLLLGFFFKEMVNFIILMSLVAVFSISTTIASYHYYKVEKAKEE